MANWELYPQALEELGRVCRPGTARAILLTHDSKVLSRVCSLALRGKSVLAVICTVLARSIKSRVRVALFGGVALLCIACSTVKQAMGSLGEGLETRLASEYVSFVPSPEKLGRACK